MTAPNLTEHVVDAVYDHLCRINGEWQPIGPNDIKEVLTAAIPFLPVQGAVKKLDLTVLERLAEYAEQYDHPDDNGPFPDIQDAMVTVGDLRQARKLLSFLSALEPSAVDMGNPITDKTVKMVMAEAIAQVWYQTRDCDVEEIDRIIAHLKRNGLLIVGSQRFRMMADAIQSAAAYLALSQPNSAENLISELDRALNGETVRANQLFGISEQLIESLIKDADWLGEYGHQMHEKSEYHDGGYTANRLQAIGDRISKLIETVIMVSQPSAGRAAVLEEERRQSFVEGFEDAIAQADNAINRHDDTSKQEALNSIRALTPDFSALSNQQPDKLADRSKNERGVHSERERVLEEAAILEALEECETYFENRSDADHDETGFVPNEEMRILVSVRAAIRALHPVADKPSDDGAQGEGWMPTHRHTKRGTDYSLIGIGKMQADNWQVSREGFDQSIDREEVAIYRSVDDGSLWVRPREEFEDGRFETLPTPPSSEVA